MLKGDETISGEGDILLDIPSLIAMLPDVTSASLIAELEQKVQHYRERVEEYKNKLRVWESALNSAREEAGEKKPKQKKVEIVFKGKANRAFVREMLKRHRVNGLKPAEILDAARAQELEIPHNFPYTILHRFKTETIPEVREEGGRYFLIEPEE